MLVPILATMKVDLHELVILKLDWDDAIPNSYRAMWESHFAMIQEINNIRYYRTVVPEDAVDLDVITLDFGDASKVLVCVAIYARFKRKCGSYSCQLVFARSRLVPEGMTQPRAELFAAVLCAHTGEVVKKAFYRLSILYVTYFRQKFRRKNGPSYLAHFDIWSFKTRPIFLSSANILECKIRAIWNFSK